ncbi:cupin domain-containing protein [Yersinia artesiana]|uniref:cupin domain-containing protein n=1 Tax=Yersinia artesiana TaxID=2890315 RepID=UPI001581C707|nr:cupin domain-containing protein [Yersinia artesiana]
MARFRPDGSSAWHELGEGDGVILTRSLGFSLTTLTGKVTAESEDTPFILRESIANYGGDYLFLIAGKMEIDKTSADLLLNELPPVIFIKSGSNESSVFTWLMNYIRNEKLFQRAGSTAVTDHLMHLIMIEGVRSWMHESDESNQGWMGALRDPRIMRVLSEIHGDPARNWCLPEECHVLVLSGGSLN